MADLHTAAAAAVRPGDLDEYRRRLADQATTTAARADRPAKVTPDQLRRRLGVNRARLAIIRAKIARLTDDPAADEHAPGLPLAARLLTLAELTDWERLVIREAELEHQILADEQRLLQVSGGAR